MSYEFPILQSALDQADQRRRAWVVAVDARLREAEGFAAAVEACFANGIKPAMDHLHCDVDRVGYYAPFVDEVEDGRRTLTLKLFPRESGAGREGSLTVTANRQDLCLDIEITVEGHQLDIKPVHPKPANLSAEDFERELVKLVNGVMIWL